MHDIDDHNTFVQIIIRNDKMLLKAIVKYFNFHLIDVIKFNGIKVTRTHFFFLSLVVFSNHRKSRQCSHTLLASIVYENAEINLSISYRSFLF